MCSCVDLDKYGNNMEFWIELSSELYHVYTYVMRLINEAVCDEGIPISMFDSLSVYVIDCVLSHFCEGIIVLSRNN